MKLYRNMKVKVHSPDGEPDNFNIVGGIMQGDKLAAHLFITCLDNILWMLIDLKKERSRNYYKEVETITDTDNANDIAPHVNTLAQLNPCYIAWNRQ